MKVLVTGSAGLIGRRLTCALMDRGFAVAGYDIGTDAHQDIRDPDSVARAVGDVDGIIHLAAVSRVVWAERDPILCEAVNERGFLNLVAAIRKSPRRPWLLFASSREVYGQQEALPVGEAAELRPMNVYARSKLFGERVVAGLAADGLAANFVRLSNVYGCARDHRDRVIPAFAAAAAHGGVIRVDGRENGFDFTHVTDVADGMARLAMLCAQGELFGPLHLTSGRQTTLAELAGLALANAGHDLRVEEAPPRDFDVARFCGCTKKAGELIGWAPNIALEDGFAELVRQFQLEPV